jgi:hypothetical protein
MMRSIKISSLIIFLCSINITKANPLSFDSLFPVTWYQKSLESCLYIWQTLTTIPQGGSKTKILYETLGRLTFVQFCVNRMHQESEPYVADDIDYLLMVLYKIQQLLALVDISQTPDLLLCTDSMINAIQDKLKVSW